MANYGTQTSKTPSVSSLAHYTNLAGLQGILESGNLWASNVAFLNDREELLHGVKCAGRALSTLRDNKLHLWRDAISEVIKQIENGRLPNTYAACFCERTDLLSQWRAYGGSEQGVSLAFNPEGLHALKSGRRSFLAPVQYALIDGKTHLRNSLRERLLPQSQPLPFSLLQPPCCGRNHLRPSVMPPLQS